jgi:hypothetical protein
MDGMDQMSEQPREWTPEYLRALESEGGLPEILNAHKAALEAAWSEHDDVVDALCVSNKTVMDFVTINRKLKEQLAAEREAHREWLEEHELQRKRTAEAEQQLAAEKEEWAKRENELVGMVAAERKKGKQLMEAIEAYVAKVKAK